MSHIPNDQQLQAASYRGIFFYVSSITTRGGRKDVLKEIVNSGNQSVEDLGLRQRSFNVTGLIAASPSNDLLSYTDARDHLIEALELGGTGTFVHPFLGEIPNVSCRTFSLDETLTAVGTANITIAFAISNTDGAPAAEDTTLGEVRGEANEGQDELEEEFSGNYAVFNKFAGNFQDALDQTREYVEIAEQATNPFAMVASEIDQFTQDLSNMNVNAASFVENPTSLADSIRNQINTINGLLATPPEVFDAMVRLFDFGDLDIRFTTDTAGGQQRQKNRDLMSDQVQGTALCEAYVVAAQLDLPTVEDIDSVSAVLETQYQKMIATNTLGSAAAEGITKTRLASTSFFNAQRADKPRQIEVFTETIPARVLAYQYYGSSDQGVAIAERNNLNDSAFLEGNVEILSS